MCELTLAIMTFFLPHKRSSCVGCLFAGAGFPPQYAGAAFIAEHGSWARETKIGYRVVAVMIAPNGTVTNHEVFVEGFLERNQTVWGENDSPEVCAGFFTICIMHEQLRAGARLCPRPVPCCHHSPVNAIWNVVTSTCCSERKVRPVNQHLLNAYVSTRRIMARHCCSALTRMTLHDQAVHVHDAHAATGEGLPSREDLHACLPCS